MKRSVTRVVLCLCLLTTPLLASRAYSGLRGGQRQTEGQGLTQEQGLAQRVRVGVETMVAVSSTSDNQTHRAERREAPHERARRQAQPNQNVRGFNQEERRVIVEKHNQLRQAPAASDMTYVYWDDDLAALAQDWAEKCDFNHRPGAQRRDVGGFRHVGENLYAGTGGYDPASVIQAWYDEVKFYSYNTMACTDVCGHYTQIVWATSYSVGCGVVYCPRLTSVSFGRGYYVACNYGPGGNYRGERPYKTGQSCSLCDDEEIFCIDGLCARYPVIGAPGGSRPTRPALNTAGYCLSILAVTSAVLSLLLQA